jgi:hypothetical protein
LGRFLYLDGNSVTRPNATGDEQVRKARRVFVEISVTECLPRFRLDANTRALPRFASYQKFVKILHNVFHEAFEFSTFAF